MKLYTHILGGISSSVGHMHRMDATRVPGCTLLIEVAVAASRVGRPLLHFKDYAKRDRFAFGINPKEWGDLAKNSTTRPRRQK